MNPAHLDALLHPDLGSAGVRGACFLLRQELEAHLAGLPEASEGASVRSLLAVAFVAHDPDDAVRLAHAWLGLSRACHAHGQQLPVDRRLVRAWADLLGGLR
jgi:hypothetical protein